MVFGPFTSGDEVASEFSDQIKGKNVIITGPSPGTLGGEVARVIAKYANLVVLAGRSQTKLDETASILKKDGAVAQIRVLIIDLSSLKSVRKAAAEVNAYSEPIHVLINNAATSVDVPYSKTEDGIEAAFACNHIAHFLFTNSILPRIKAAITPDYSPRIITVASIAHKFSAFDLKEIGWNDGKTYHPLASYMQTKNANLLFTYELAKRLKSEGIISLSLNPGVIWTPLFAQVSKDLLVQGGFTDAEGNRLETYGPWKTLAQGASTYIVAAFDPSLKNATGGYLDNCQLHNEGRAAWVLNPETAAKLWDLSESLVEGKGV